MQNQCKVLSIIQQGYITELHVCSCKVYNINSLTINETGSTSNIGIASIVLDQRNSLLLMFNSTLSISIRLLQFQPYMASLLVIWNQGPTCIGSTIWVLMVHMVVSRIACNNSSVVLLIKQLKRATTTVV